MPDFWKNDLPQWFDPMTVKELRQSLRRGSFVYPFLLIHVLAIGAMVAEFGAGTKASSTGEAAGMLNVFMLAESGPLWSVASIICLLVMPLAGLVLMGQEMEEGNHELLQIATLNRWKIVLGKFITLWGLSVLTLLSLLPYVVVRYWVGGIEWGHELACITTVAGGAALIAAGAIGASAFRKPAARAGIFLLYLFSAALGCGIPLMASTGSGGDLGWLYHLTAISGLFAYTALGLSIARSRLRLSILAYEVSPSGLVIALLALAPFAIGFLTAVSLGMGGFVGLVGLGILAIKIDVSPKLALPKPPPMPMVAAAPFTKPSLPSAAPPGAARGASSE